MSLSRINTNIQSLRALSNLQNANSQLSMRQLRLSTGKRINRAQDDAAGYAIARKLEARNRGLSQALANIGDGKSMLTVAEGGLDTIMDIVQEMKEKATQAANGSLSDAERTDIQEEIINLSSEIDEIVDDMDFNGDALFSVSGSTNFNFQVGDGQDDNITVSIGAMTAAYQLVTSGGGQFAIDVSTMGGATAALGELSTVINQLSDRLAGLGSDMKRMSFKEQNVKTAKTNYAAARSQIEDADFAREQMEIAKLQILQQTGTAALSQANSSPQAVLGLIGGGGQ